LLLGLVLGVQISNINEHNKNKALQEENIWKKELSFCEAFI